MRKLRGRLLSGTLVLLLSVSGLAVTVGTAWAQSRVSSTLDGRTITVVGGSAVSTSYAGSRGEISLNGFSITIQGDRLEYDSQSLDIGSTGEVELIADGDKVAVIVAGTEVGTLERSLEDVIADLKRRADAGEARAQNQLGVRYAQGEGVEESLEQAAHYYRLAAEQGEVFAMANLAFLLVHNEGYPDDYAEGLRWFTAAAEQGDDIALIELGIIYERGIGVEVDYVKAHTLWLEAAEMGNAIAQYNTALTYRNGQGVEENQEQGLYWLRLSANQDYEPARNLLEELTTQAGNSDETDTVLVADDQFPPTLPPASETQSGPPPLPGGPSGPPPLPEPTRSSLPPYYAGIGGISVGPLNEAQLRDRVAADELSPATLVWTEGMADWQPAREVAEIAALFETQAEAPEPLGFDGEAFLVGTWSGSGETMVEDVGMMPYKASMTYNQDGAYTLTGTLDVQIPQLPQGQTVAFNVEGSGTWTMQSATQERIVIRRVGNAIISAPDLGIREDNEDDMLDFLQVVEQNTYRDSEGLEWTRQGSGS